MKRVVFILFNFYPKVIVFFRGNNILHFSNTNMFNMLDSEKLREMRVKTMSDKCQKVVNFMLH